MTPRLGYPVFTGLATQVSLDWLPRFHWIGYPVFTGLGTQFSLDWVPRFHWIGYPGFTGLATQVSLIWVSEVAGSALPVHLLCLSTPSFDNYEVQGDVDRFWRDPSFRSYFKVVHILNDICPYWSQVSLTLALAVERYIIICHGTKAKSILSTRNRILFYIAVGFSSFLGPALIMGHYGATGVTQVRI